jgi:predicted  nucleic acid-binding Zn-ribbon protein
MASQQDLLANLQALTQQAQGGIPRMVQPTSRTNGPQFSAAPKFGKGLTDKYASTNTNPNEIKANQAKIKLNRTANVASARYPGLTDKFGSIAAGEKQDSGVLGAVFNNPIAKTFLKGIEVIDTPRRAIISGVREIADVFDNNKDTSFSVTDWFNQTKDPMYGFGKAFPMKGWGGRIIGLIGDIALDPLTYASLGTYIPAEVAAEGARGGLRAAMQGVKHLNTAEGRMALANLARKKGATPAMQKALASEGRLALKGSAEMAQAMGMRKSGVYLFDSRFFPKAMSTRLPGSGQVADFIERRLVNNRLGFWNTGFGTRLGKKLTRAGVDEADTSAIRFAIASGQLDASEITPYLQTMQGKNAQRIANALAKDVAVKTLVPIIEDSDVALTKETLYKFLDTPEELWAGLGRVATPQETVAYTKVRETMQGMVSTVKERLAKLGLDIGEFDSYFPHMASEQTLKLMDDTTSDYLRNAVRSYLTVNIADTAKAFGHRTMRSGDDFFGHILTGEDIMAGIDRMNEIAKRAIHPGGKKNPSPIAFNFFETDVTKVLSQYANQYAGTHGAIGFMEDMIQSGGYKLGDEVVEFDMEAAQAADELVKSKARAYSSAVNDSIIAGKNVTKEINDSLTNVTRAKATTVAPRGAVQLEVDAARTAMNEVLPVDVATKRLTAAQTALSQQMKKLNDSWMDLSNEFSEQSNVLLLMNQSHKDLIASHQKVLDELGFFIAKKEKISPTIPGLKSEKAKLEAALKKLSKQIDSHNNAMDAAVNMGPEINQMIDGTYRALDDLTGEVLDSKIFVGNQSLQDIVNFFQKSPFAGQSAGVTAPLGKAAVGKLVKLAALPVIFSLVSKAESV